ncbi:MAG: FliH/SctL family protein [Campylobacterota bacterium]|nr:FliH/SctL family protein [Campylobacterota bacterium]
MASNNVNSKSQIIKSDSEIQSFELGNFIPTNTPSESQVQSSAKLNDKSINGNIDPVLEEIKNLQQSIAYMNEKVSLIESDGVKGRDLDKQLIEALKDLKNYSTFFEQATFQMETKILKTSFSIAQKIIAIEIGENSAKIARETILSIMSKIKTASRITIHLNPKDYVTLKDQLNFESFVTLQEDSNVTAGGVVIASDLGNFDGNIESKVQTMLESLDAVI